VILVGEVSLDDTCSGLDRATKSADTAHSFATARLLSFGNSRKAISTARRLSARDGHGFRVSPMTRCRI